MHTAKGQTTASDDAVGVARPRTRARRTPISVVGVLGELFVTAGVIALLFVVWQLWIGDIIAGVQNNNQGRELAEEWSAAPVPTTDPTTDPTAAPSPDPTAAPAPPTDSIPVLDEAGDGEVFGIMYIPRFGPDYAVRMAGGVSRATTLDTIGIGHYPGTDMPGGIGNTAYAAHRTGYGGAPFLRLAELHINDAIVIETPDGWYTYRFRNLEYVRPDATAVLHGVPQDAAEQGADRFLTLTTCAPKHTIIERLIAYSVFDSFQSRADGPPDSLAAPAGEA